MEPDAGGVLRSNVAIDGVAGDPFAIGKGDASRLGVVGNDVVTLVGPVFESPATLVFIARFAENVEAVGTHHGRLVAAGTCSLCILGGPGARQRVIEVNMRRRITRVGGTEAPLREALAHLVLPVITDFGDTTSRLTNCETMCDFRALGEDGRRVVLDCSCDGGLVRDGVGRRYRTFGVLDGNEGLDGILPRPLVVGPGNSVGPGIVNAAISGGNEFRLRGKRIDDLNILDLHEASGVDAILL